MLTAQVLGLEFTIQIRFLFGLSIRCVRSKPWRGNGVAVALQLNRRFPIEEYSSCQAGALPNRKIEKSEGAAASRCPGCCLSAISMADSRCRFVRNAYCSASRAHDSKTSDD
jgi:hypothetical protein